MANFDPLWRQRLCYYPNQHIAHGFTSRLTGPLWPSWQCALCTGKQYWSRHGSSYWHLVAALWCAQARGWAPCPRGVPAAMAMAPNRDCYKARQYQPIAQPSVDPLRCSSKSSRKKIESTQVAHKLAWENTTSQLVIYRSGWTGAHIPNWRPLESHEQHMRAKTHHHELQHVALYIFFFHP